jgi:hypothetical protein
MSHPRHGEHRDAIRKSWGNLTRFPHVKKLFLLGSCESLTLKESPRVHWPSELELQIEDHGRIKSKKKFISSHPTAKMTVDECKLLIKEENERHRDILQIDYRDTYYNNTIKSLTSMRWTFENCPLAENIVYIDDDYYLSMEKLLPFLEGLRKIDESNLDAKYYGGWVRSGLKVARHFNKWYASIGEYSFDVYPDFVTGGIVFMSKRAFRELLVASLFVKPFKLWDISLAIVAKKIGLEPIHNKDMIPYQYEYDRNKFRNVIARHFSDPPSMLNAWFDQHGTQDQSTAE